MVISHICSVMRGWRDCGLSVWVWGCSLHYLEGDVLSAGPGLGQPVLAWPERSCSSAVWAKWCQSVTGFHSMSHTSCWRLWIQDQEYIRQSCWDIWCHFRCNQLFDWYYVMDYFQSIFHFNLFGFFFLRSDSLPGLSITMSSWWYIVSFLLDLGVCSRWISSGH